MKKIAVLMILAVLAFSGSAHAAARSVQKAFVPKDSAWLADENVMTSNIDQARGNTPLGAIVAYPNNSYLSAYVTEDYVECNGSPVPTDSDLYKKMGVTKTPNLYKGKGKQGLGYFLRAGKDNVTYTSSDTFLRHLHGQPAHTHKTSGELLNTAVTTNLNNDEVNGTAAAQKMMYNWTWWHDGPSPNPRGAQTEGGNWVQTGGDGIAGWDGAHSHSTGYGSTSQHYGHIHIFEPGGGGVLGPRTFYATTYPSAVTGKVVNKQSTGHVLNPNTSGVTDAQGGDDTFYTGDDETAPTYYTVRYFMRVNE